MDILERKRIVDRLNKIYEPMDDTIEQIQNLRSDLEGLINEVEDHLISLGYEKDSLKELIENEEAELAELILMTHVPIDKIKSQGINQEQILKASIARIIK